ncbi:MAG: nucleotidyltransferase domain-containing protein [Proteobacteria bacterium]|nr:nucleotidyltransferase domain-containing protein [Pseudomonadota bacterium]
MVKQKPLGKKEIDSINKYKKLLKQKGIKVSKVILFGSHAKGTANLESDLDLAVISSQFGQDNLKEMMLLRKLALEIDSHIEPLPFSPQDLDDRYSTLVQEIKKYGVTI